MLVTPVPPDQVVVDRLRWSSAASVGLKLSFYVGTGAHPGEVAAAVDACWVARPPDASPTLLQAVLRHVHSSSVELRWQHRSHISAPGLACFAVLDGSIQEDEWLEFDTRAPTMVHLGPRFLLSPLQPPAAVPVTAPAEARLVLA
ncbi:MAG: hypothetical protein JWL76_272 [Thermoleophilia bacterium]|nr:hypothetical protein [Thermoleophilia bacterium]